MSATLPVRDETAFAFGGEKEFNARRPGLSRGFVQQTDVEKTVNSFRVAV